MTTIYFAGPLFTQAEVNWNRSLAEELRKLDYTVLLPQDTAAPYISEGEIDTNGIFRQNKNDIDRADAVVAVLDGTDVDSGTAWEIGYAFAKQKPIVGIRSDFRAGGDSKDVAVNLMIDKALGWYVEIPHTEPIKVIALRISSGLGVLVKRTPTL